MVVFTRHSGRWLFSRHRMRDTWETQGGHIEPGETPLAAARRELWEECGAEDFSIAPVCDYHAADEDSAASGQVFYVEVRSIGPLPSNEMAEVREFDGLPEKLTYSGITPVLFARVKRWLLERGVPVHTMLCASVFLRRGGKYLVMKRAENKRLAPGKWAPIGGKLEPRELNDPANACLREVEEETGIAPYRIADFRLRYILIRIAGTEIRQDYVYFGETDACDVIDTNEGELHWVDEGDLLSLDFTPKFAVMVRHSVANQDEKRVFVGVAGVREGTPHVEWSVLEDYD